MNSVKFYCLYYFYNKCNRTIKMNKENNRGAAGLRRSAVAERIRLREEWSALKGIDESTSSQTVLAKRPTNTRCTPATLKKRCQVVATNHKVTNQTTHVSSDALCGVVALVEVGDEAKALPLRAALTALGASVVGRWSPLVTHLVWADGGCRASRAKARALGSRLVSPLWVEACAGANTKLGERAFPTSSRQSDLPSPRTLRQLLKKAEIENVPLVELLSSSKEDEENPKPLRISTDTEHDTSTDKTTDTSNDTIDVESRINTAPRRALPNTSISPDRPTRSRRKLFTQKEAVTLAKNSGDESEATPTIDRRRVRIQHKLTQQDRRDLARAERMAKRILAGCITQETRNNVTQTTTQYRIVLTGMSRTERQAVTKAIQELNGKIQNHVSKRTTHVLLGSCRSDDRPDITGITSCDNGNTGFKNGCNKTMDENIGIDNRNGVLNHCYLSGNFVDKKARTVNALQGAARGCRVLYAKWALDSAIAKKWIHHHGYEVQHLKKICQKARVERNALGRMHSEYAYDVFNGMRVRITLDAEQREAAALLLRLCGAVVTELNGRRTHNGGKTQDGGQTQDGVRTQVADGGRTQDGGRPQNGGSDCDLIIGSDIGEISSKWVFDSVAVARMRTTRRYINCTHNLNNHG